MRILILGHTSSYRLEQSYARALVAGGHNVVTVDVDAEIRAHARLGKLGRSFNDYVPVEAWIAKGNRAAILQAIGFRPDLVLVFAWHRVRVGALAQIRSICGSRIVVIWPDPLLQIDHNVADVMRYSDLVATYGRHTVEAIRKLGCTRVEWLPLAADPSLHGATSPTKGGRSFDVDVAFVGGWRPERESLIARVFARLGQSRTFKLWGTDWNKADDPQIRSAWQRSAPRGPDFSRTVQGAKINLNIIDVLNHTAANMRLFELACAGGLQLSSYCEELSETFVHREHILYFRGAEECADLIEEVLGDDVLRARVVENAYALVMAGHTYESRAKSLLSWLPGC